MAIDARFTDAMPFMPCSADPVVRERLAEMCRDIRRARLRAGLSQERLEWMSGVDQTAISRLERGLAARFPLERLARISVALRGELPVATCPHDHRCRWRPETGDPGDPFGQLALRDAGHMP